MKYIFLIVIALSGCQNSLVKKTDVSIDDDFNSAEYYNSKNLIVEKQEQIDSKIIDDDFIEMETHVSRYPDVFGSDIVLNRGANEVSINFVADYIFRKTGIITRISDDANSFELYQDGQKLEKGFLTINYSGNLKDFLNYISAKCGLSWNYENDEINIFRFGSKTWFINGFAGSTSNSSNITSNITSSGGGSGEGGGGGFSNQAQSGRNSVFSSNVQILNNIHDTVKSFLSKDGKLFLSEGTSSITVTDRPHILNKINTFVNSINQRISTNINFEISIFNVSKDDQNNKGIGLNAIWDNIREYNLNLDLFGATVDQSSGFGLDVNDPGSQFFGSKFVASLFSKYGKVTVKENVNLSTLPGQAVPFQYANEKGYIQEVSTTIVSNAGATTNITQGKATTGIDIEILPVLSANNNLLVQFSMFQSALRGIDSFESGGFKIQQPDTDIRNFVERVHVKSGELIVLAGYDQSISRINTQSPFGKAWFLGGSKDAQKRKTMLVVVIRPLIIKRG